MMTLKDSWLNSVLIILLVFTSCTKKITDYSFEKQQHNANDIKENLYDFIILGNKVLIAGSNATLWTTSLN